MTIRAELDNMRERVEAATEGPWEAGGHDASGNLYVGTFCHDCAPSCGMLGEPVATAGESDAEFIAHARTDLPRLLDAVEKVLELHKPFETRQGTLICDHCLGNCAFDESEPIDWPCETVQAITTALEGK